MGAVNLVVMVESVRDLVEHSSDSDTNAFHLPSIVAVAAALGEFQSSFTLILTQWCLRGQNSAIFLLSLAS